MTPQPDTERMGLAQALACLARSRDARAWESIVVSVGAEIQALALRLLFDEALAEDAVQETLLLVREHAGKFQPPADDPDRGARSWILKITANTALKILRTRKRMLARENQEAQERVMSTTHPSQASKEYDLEAVQKEIERLPEHERTSVLLHFYGGLEYRQLAGALGCPVGTIKARVNRGLERLRSRLELAGVILTGPELLKLIPTSPLVTAGAMASAEQLARWQAILSAPQSAALTLAGESIRLAAFKGSSLAAKVALIATTVVIVGTLAVAVLGGGSPDYHTPAPLSAPADLLGDYLQQLRSPDPAIREAGARGLSAAGISAHSRIQQALDSEKDPLVRMELQWLLKDGAKAGQIVWQRRLGQPQKIDSHLSADCARLGATIVVACPSLPALFCLDAVSGELLWQKKHDNCETLYLNPIVGFGQQTVLARHAGIRHFREHGSDSSRWVHELSALNMQTGNVVWTNTWVDTFGWSYNHLYAAIVGENVVVRESTPPLLRCRKIDNGEEVWRRDLGEDFVILSEQSPSQKPLRYGVALMKEQWRVVDLLDGQVLPVIPGEPQRVYAPTKHTLAFKQNVLSAYNTQTLEKLWQVDLPGKCNIIPDAVFWVRELLQLDEIAIFSTISEQHWTTYALDQASGKILWTREGTNGLVARRDDGCIYLTEPNSLWREPYGGHATPVDLRTGEVRAAYPRTGERSIGADKSALIVNGRVYESRHHRRLDGADSFPELSEEQRIAADPLTRCKDVLQCVDAQTGKLLWRSDFYGPVSIVHLGGFIIVSTPVGEVRCYRIVD